MPPAAVHHGFLEPLVNAPQRIVVAENATCRKMPVRYPAARSISATVTSDGSIIARPM